MLAFHVGEHLHRLGDVVLRQLDDDAVVEAQIPTATGDANEGPHPRADLRPAGKLVVEIGGRRFGIAANEQRQRRKLVVAQRRNHAAASFDQRKIGAVLPDAKGLALGKVDLDRAGIDLAHRHALNPGHFRDQLAGLGDIERHQRRRAVQAELLEDVDLRGLVVAGNLDVFDRKSRGGGRSLREVLRMTAERHAVEARRSKKGERRDRAGMGRKANAASTKTDEEAHDTTERTRQHTAAVHIDGCSAIEVTNPLAPSAPQRKHDASSTIQLKNSPKL
ncbi:hypothetical protein D9M72_417020 [compost metagenome]